MADGQRATSTIVVDASAKPRPTASIRRARGGFVDNRVVLEVDLALQGPPISISCALAIFLKENGEPLMSGDGTPVRAQRNLTRPSDLQPLELSLPANELGLTGRRNVGKHDLSAQVAVWAESCDGLDPNQPPIVASGRIPFCVRKHSVGYDACD